MDGASARKAGLGVRFAYLIEPPFNFRRDDGIVSGCDVELARHVAEVIGTRFEPIEATFSELLPGLGLGRWQMTTGLFATRERKRMAAFSRPIWALPDGLLVQKSNPLGLSGYRSIAAMKDCVVAVIRDQFQHRSAVEFGVPDHRIRIFETYADAAHAIQNGQAHAYASVARAHMGHLALHPQSGHDVVVVPPEEKSPAFGSFGFKKTDRDLLQVVDAVLAAYLGTPAHRTMMAKYGFTDAEIDLTAA
jgi:polar amino acid transport system substrate-binding protein